MSVSFYPKSAVSPALVENSTTDSSDTNNVETTVTVTSTDSKNASDDSVATTSAATATVTSNPVPLSDAERMQLENAALKRALFALEHKYGATVRATFEHEKSAVKKLAKKQRDEQYAAQCHASEYSPCGVSAGTPSALELSSSSSLSPDWEVIDVSSLPPEHRTHREELVSYAQSLNTEAGTSALFANLQSYVSSPAFLQQVRTFRTDDDEQVYVEAPLDGVTIENDCKQVGMVDVDSVDWWVLVPEFVHDPNDPTTVNLDAPAGAVFKTHHIDEYEIGDINAVDDEDSDTDSTPYVLVDDVEVVQAVGEFVAMFISKIPETHKLSEQQLQTMLTATFSELQEKSFCRKMWDYGNYLYSGYSWSASLLALYRDPAIVRAVLRGVWTVSKYLMLFAV
jgi:hypothetical protein